MPATDFSQLEGLRNEAQSAGSAAANLSGQSASLLDTLKSNLTGIFSKNVADPTVSGSLGEARGQALSDFLSTPARARAEFLPTNLPQVEGSALNLSPTQQNAITTSRQSAALAPLAGLNQVITGLYGNIPQSIQSAANLYQGAIQQQQLQAQTAQQAYENAFRELQQKEAIRQFDAELALKRSGGGTAAGRVTQQLQQIAQSASRGATLDDIMRQFGTNAELSPDEILRVYNTNSIYGPAQESPSSLANKYGVKFSQKQLETGQSERSILAGLGDLRSKMSNIGRAGLGDVASGDLQTYGDSRRLVTQEVARLIESGRLTDEDRKFYLDRVPSALDLALRPEIAKKRLNEIENHFKRRLGESTNEQQDEWELVF